MPELTEVGFWLKKIVGDLLLYPTSPLIVLVIGLGQLRRRPRVGAALLTIGTLVLLVFALPIVANAIAAYDERQFPPLDASLVLPPHAAIVVLSGGSQSGATDYGGETVNLATLARLRSAAHLAARTHLPILVTGGRLPESKGPEAALMVDAMTHDFNTPVKWTESESLDTDDNARYSVPILKAAGVTSIVLVTDVGHMRRARALFEARGMPVIPAPTDYYASAPISVLSFIPTANAMRRSAWSLHEWLGVLWMRMRS
jgi:uncharacterized SAM-binding protein YcdF (DUF218 family)